MSYAVSKSTWLTATATLVVAAISASATISFFFSRKRWRNMELKVEELEVSLRASSEKCAAERQGRIRSQQALRTALAQQTSSDLELTSYPITPIGFVQSCFSNRNGTPRQPLLVPLARACVAFDPARVPPASLEGLGEYSHCWILYVFHLNTDLEKLWKHPSKSKFKAKVRVPRLKGGKMGVFSTRTPHRPNPIGLTVAKVEAVQGHMVLLSGVDLVDGTPILDVKPYLPYSDAIQGATVPEWVKVDELLAVASVSFSEGFFSTLSKCWVTAEKSSLYSSHEFQSLITQVLSWDIRSSSQRNQSHEPLFNDRAAEKNSDLDNHQGDKPSDHETEEGSAFIYHLMLEDLDVSYKIDGNSHVVVERVELSSKSTNGNRNRCTYKMWKDKLG